MLVSISKDISSSNNNDDLTKLWFTILNKHQLYLIKDEDINALIDSCWYKALNDINRKLINESIIQSISGLKQKSKVVIITNESGDGYTLVEGEKYLAQPLTIILENSLHDGYFFDSLLKCFSGESKKIIQHKDERWVKYGMGSGSSIMQVIDTELKSFSSAIFTKPKYKYLHFFVLIDSDKKSKDEDLNHSKLDLIKYLEENEIQFHVLEKREIENYLPNEAFVEITDNSDYISAYLSLTAEQKDFFDIEKGLMNKPFVKLDDNIQSLYSDIPDEHKKLFRKESLKNINGKKNNFKTYFPKIFDSSQVTRKSLQKRVSHQDDPNELLNILKKVNELL